MSLLHNNEPFYGYTVLYLIKTGTFAQTYRIADAAGESFFLKLLNTTALPASMLTPSGEPLEIAISRTLDHPAIIRFCEAGHLEIEGARHDYMVTQYLQGELVAERLQRETCLPTETALSITIRILEGLEYLHWKGANRLSHNDITARNIMFDTDEQGTLHPCIIDMGHTAAPCSGKAPFPTEDLEPMYRAPETFLGVYDAATDVFSVGVLLYRMLFGCMPWPCDLKGCDAAETKKRLREARSEELALPRDKAQGPLDDSTIEALRRALSPSRSGRYSSAQKFRDALVEKNTSSTTKSTSGQQPEQNIKSTGKQEKNQGTTHTAQFKRGKGGGFADVAGMDELKNHLRMKVINILCDKEKAARYRLSIPNGMLLYGPPGCGKTFLAEKFAEEAGFDYSMVCSSDLSSTYIHGSQQMIGSLFREARQKAPAVICFDEFDALAPNRKGVSHSGQSGEVNEFLSQLNNCGKDNIFVIATSNRPEMIDPAILRTGRIDRLVYVPLPDTQARKTLFALNLKGRPCEELDLDELAVKTENYVASDIAYLVNDAATSAAFADAPISQTILLETLSCMRPSITREVLAEYETLRQRMEQGTTRERTRIGYKP